MLFDTQAPISINLISPDGPKKVSVRYPTDDEFSDWRRKKKMQQKDLGRRSFQITPLTPEDCDLALANAIRLDKENGPPIDKAEAYFIVNRLLETEVREQPEREGSQFTIKMVVMRRLPVTHTLRVPSVQEMMDYERGRSSVTFGQYGQQDIRINYRAAGKLYDSLKQATSGYTNGVPIPHKAEAINVLLQEIRAEQEDTPLEDDETGEA
jgi:hypothetical protein